MLSPLDPTVCLGYGVWQLGLCCLTCFWKNQFVYPLEPHQGPKVMLTWCSPTRVHDLFIAHLLNYKTAVSLGKEKYRKYRCESENHNPPYTPTPQPPSLFCPEPSGIPPGVKVEWMWTPFDMTAHLADCLLPWQVASSDADPVTCFCTRTLCYFSWSLAGLTRFSTSCFRKREDMCTAGACFKLTLREWLRNHWL